MRKKSILCYILCVLFLFSLTACAGTQPSASEHKDEVLQATEKQDPKPTAPEKEEAVPEPTEKQDSESIGEPPEDNIRFDSISDIKAFFSEENRTQINNSTENTAQSIYQYATQSKAAQLSNQANALYYPVTNTAGGIYYGENSNYGPFLEFIYVIDGIQYRFLYLFDHPSEIVLEGELAFSDVQIGPYTVDLNRVDERVIGPSGEKTFLVGALEIDGFRMTIRIQGANHEEKFDFSNFDFVQLSSVSDHVAS